MASINHACYFVSGKNSSHSFRHRYQTPICLPRHKTNRKELNLLYWYAVVKDEQKRMYLPLTGPYESKSEAEATCDTAYQRFTKEVNSFADFYPHGVISTHRLVKTIYGKSPSNQG